MEDQVIGAFCFLQIASPELQQALEVQRQQENKLYGRMKELAYICQEIKKPLSGIRFTNSLLEATNLTEDQKTILEISAACEKRMLKIIKDVNLEQIDDSSLELEKADFLLGGVIDAVVSQGMLLLREKGLQLICDIPEEIKTLCVYGDQIRIQQVLANFLLDMVRYSPSPQGWVEIQVQISLKQISNGITTMRSEFRYTFWNCFTNFVNTGELVEAGDHVDIDEPIAQVETDKVTIDVASPESGIIKEFVAKEGDTVEPETKVAIILKYSEARVTFLCPSGTTDLSPYGFLVCPFCNLFPARMASSFIPARMAFSS
ncbi:Histidine kinase domain-containing protein [Heracleum sosnowskyi]|uniref:histidine kinase n=1 Tax=Heracleum sosnowskyi TaxID=360622 RepID=A0AAD8J2W8_9APIA|nr:Histidine kinase domain-containing protein [Heracleum sosnowskyi]